MKKLLILFTFLFSFSVFSSVYNSVNEFEINTGVFTSSSFKVYVATKDDGLYASIVDKDSDITVEINSFKQLKENYYMLELYWSYSTKKSICTPGFNPTCSYYDYKIDGVVAMYYSDFAELLDVDFSGSDEIELVEWNFEDKKVTSEQTYSDGQWLNQGWFSVR
jgi:hypothetical protein